MILLAKISIAVIFISFYFLVRASQVFRYKMYLIHEIDRVNKEEILAGVYDKWEKRFDYFSSISFNEMVLKGWKRVDSFYDEDELLNREEM